MRMWRPRGLGQNARFEVIRESNKTFSKHIVLDGKCLTMWFMTKLRHQQPSLWHPGLTKDIEDLWEPWMRLVDRLLEDEQLLDTIYEAQGERYPQSRRRGREQTPAEVVLRLLLLETHSKLELWTRWSEKCARIWCNLVYRAFTRIGDEKVPDAKTLARLGQLIGPEVMEELHQRIVRLAQEHGVTKLDTLRASRASWQAIAKELGVGWERPSRISQQRSKKTLRGVAAQAPSQYFV
jgi:hypothetical protein